MKTVRRNRRTAAEAPTGPKRKPRRGRSPKTQDSKTRTAAPDTASVRAAAYVRKSHRSPEQPNSLRYQAAAIRRYASARGYSIVRWYRDERSGVTSKRRPSFRHMMADDEAGTHDFELLLVYDITRFGRFGVAESAFWRHFLDLHGVRCEFVNERLSGDDSDDLIVPLLEWMAEEHSRKRSQDHFRSVATLRDRTRRLGRPFYWGSRPPYGYDLAILDDKGNTVHVIRKMSDGTRHVISPEGKTTRVVPCGTARPRAPVGFSKYVLSLPERVAAVRKVFELRASGSMGEERIAKAIASEAGLQGWPPPSGDAWTPSHVQCIYTNEVYTGVYIYNRTSRGTFHSLSETGVVAATGRRSVDRKDWMVIPGAHPPIVGRDVFLQAQQPVRRRAGPGNRGKAGQDTGPPAARPETAH